VAFIYLLLRKQLGVVDGTVQSQARPQLTRGGYPRALNPQFNSRTLTLRSLGILLEAPPIIWASSTLYL